LLEDNVEAHAFTNIAYARKKTKNTSPFHKGQLIHKEYRFPNREDPESKA